VHARSRERLRGGESDVGCDTFKLIATNPPSIATAGGVLLMLAGDAELGKQIFTVGVVLQVLWLLLRYGIIHR
jgi:hypothetical protein